MNMDQLSMLKSKELIRLKFCLNCVSKFNSYRVEDISQQNFHL